MRLFLKCMLATIFCDDIVFSQDFANAYHLLALPLVINRPSELAEVQRPDAVPEYNFQPRNSENILSNSAEQNNNHYQHCAGGLIVD